MRTKGAKRAGRKTKPGARYPSGELKKPRAEQREKIMSVAIASRQRNIGVPEGFASTAQAGYSLGVLYYDRCIERKHHDAGLMVADIIYDYYRHKLNMAPPIPQALDMARVRGRSLSEQVEHPRLSQIVDRYKAMQSSIRRVDEPGRPVSRMIAALCIEDDRPQNTTNFMLGWLKSGLGAVHEQFAEEIDANYGAMNLVQKKSV